MTKFQFATPAQQIRALGPVDTLPEIQRLAFDLASPLLQPVAAPKAGDWLTEQTEKGQTFEQWKRWCHIVPHASFRTISIVPIGAFPPGMSPPLELLGDFCRASFTVMNVAFEKNVPKEKVGAHERISPETGAVQVLVTDLQNFVESCRPNKREPHSVRLRLQWTMCIRKKAGAKYCGAVLIERSVFVLSFLSVIVCVSLICLTRVELCVWAGVTHGRHGCIQLCALPPKLPGAAAAAAAA